MKNYATANPRRQYRFRGLSQGLLMRLGHFIFLRHGIDDKDQQYDRRRHAGKSSSHHEMLLSSEDSTVGEGNFDHGLLLSLRGRRFSNHDRTIADSRPETHHAEEHENIHEHQKANQHNRSRFHLRREKQDERMWSPSKHTVSPRQARPLLMVLLRTGSGNPSTSSTHCGKKLPASSRSAISARHPSERPPQYSSTSRDLAGARPLSRRIMKTERSRASIPREGALVTGREARGSIARKSAANPAATTQMPRI